MSQRIQKGELKMKRIIAILLVAFMVLGSVFALSNSQKIY